jgi:3-methyladenine DNA glycosylase AlkD
MNANPVSDIRNQLEELSDAAIAEHSQRFFKTGLGQYGEGDVFIGIRVPVLRRVAKANRELSLGDAELLLRSAIHEERLLALLVLVLQFEKGDAPTRKAIYKLYCSNMQYVNNWDLVDSSSHQIVGGYLRDRSKRPLHQLAKSGNLWKRRVAIISTLAYIKDGEFDETLAIAETLLHDEEDLIHKAVGWMLREVGNRDRSVEESLLKRHYRDMPRTMLRYAIEKFPETKRKRYLNGKI